jgi:hypothetical protein
MLPDWWSWDAGNAGAGMVGGADRVGLGAWGREDSWGLTSCGPGVGADRGRSRRTVPGGVRRLRHCDVGGGITVRWTIPPWLGNPEVTAYLTSMRRPGPRSMTESGPLNYYDLVTGRAGDPRVGLTCADTWPERPGNQPDPTTGLTQHAAKPSAQPPGH